MLVMASVQSIKNEVQISVPQLRDILIQHGIDIPEGCHLTVTNNGQNVTELIVRWNINADKIFKAENGRLEECEIEDVDK